MITEEKILMHNIKTLRKLPLNEAYDEQSIIDAIEHHKVIIIGYDGDDTIMSGQRTVMPFVLGTSKAGNKVLRAWEQAGASDSFYGLNRTPRQGHEKHNGPFGQKPGWRLFRLDGITSVIPTGRMFEPEKYFVTGDGVKYKPDDGGMTSIDIAIQKTPSVFEPQAKKYQFFKAAKRAREATAGEVERLWTIVTQYWKENANKFWVIQDEKGDMVLKRENQLKDVPREAIVGKLRELYNRLVAGKRTYDTKFHEKQKDDTLRQLGEK